MTELNQDTPLNNERRKTLHEAAKLRYRLRTEPESLELQGITEDMIMKADYDTLKKLVESIRK
jgi:hypothetical protein